MSSGVSVLISRGKDPRSPKLKIGQPSEGQGGTKSVLELTFVVDDVIGLVLTT